MRWDGASWLARWPVDFRGGCAISFVDEISWLDICVHNIPTGAMAIKMIPSGQQWAAFVPFVAAPRCERELKGFRAWKKLR